MPVRLSFPRLVAVAASFALGGFATAQSPRPATLSGRVFIDTLLKPIPGVEITIIDLDRKVTSDDKGVFKIDGIGPGKYEVMARKIGFAAYRGTITFREGEDVKRAIVLPRVAPLDTVRVVGESNVPLSFLEHRAVGLGHFLSRDDLAHHGGGLLSDAMADFPGIKFMTGSQSRAWPLSKHYMIPIRATCAQGNHAGDPWYCPEAEEIRQGMKPGCFAQVYLDGMLLNAGNPTPPVNINEFASMSLEAVEYYSGPAQTPPELSRLNSPCGVLVIHTRRSFDSLPARKKKPD